MSREDLSKLIATSYRKPDRSMRPVNRPVWNFATPSESAGVGVESLGFIGYLWWLKWYLLFNGTDSYISIPHSSTLSPDGKDWTAEVWFRNRGANGVLLSRGKANQESGYAMYIHNNIAKAAVGINGTRYVANSNLNIHDDRWHHIAISISSTQLKLFLDGILVSTVTIPGYLPDSGSQSTFIGWDNNIGIAETSSYFNGDIGEVRCYNRVFESGSIIYHLGGGF